MISVMDHRTTALERAFQLAKSGEVSGVPGIRKALEREGYFGSQIEGPLLKRQLVGLIKAARERDLSVHRT
jgi:hypothetical protein